MDRHREDAARSADRAPVTGSGDKVRHDIRLWPAPAGTLRIPVRAHCEYDREETGVDAFLRECLDDD